MPGKVPVPFPEFERWRWAYDPDKGPRDKPETDPKKTCIKAKLPEAQPPPDWGITYEEYRDDVAKWSDERLNGELACLEDNLRNNTMPLAMERALREAREARYEALQEQKYEYQRRSKSLVFDEAEKAAKRRKKEAEEVGPHGETTATHDRVTEKHKTGGKGQVVTAVHWVKREPSTGAQ